MDRIDEAVEAALGSMPASLTHSQAWPTGYVDGHNDAMQTVEAHMRAALLAGVKVLLGEPVAWAHPLDVDAVADADMETGNVMRLFPTDRGDMPRVALYAPSLGEGDGR